MIFGVCIGAMSEQTEAKLSLLERCGIEGVELAGRVLERTGEEDPDAYRQSLQIAAERLPGIGVRSITVHLPFWPVDISSPDAEERRIALGIIARSLAGYGEFFPGGLAVVHPGEVIADPQTEPERMAHSIDSLCRVADMAAAVGVRLAIENMPAGTGPFAGKNFVGQDIDFLLSMLGEIAADHVGLCFDVGHANQVGDVCQMARDCGRHLMHVHLSDNRGDQDTHLPPGEGTVPWGELGDVLFEIGYNGAAVLEVGLREEESYEELIEASRAHLVDWVW